MPKQPTPANREEPAAKKIKVDQVVDDVDIVFEALKECEELSEKLHAIDMECAAQQMKIQREFDSKKKPMLLQRDKILASKPGFWGNIIAIYPNFEESLNPADIDILKKYLETIEVNDNLDEEGSYEIIFGFNSASPFTPTTLRKKVVFNQDDKIVIDDVETTQIVFTDPKSDPRTLVAALQRDEEEEEEDEDSFAPGSFFSWFSEPTISHPVLENFGEIIRRQIYPNPHSIAALLVEDSDQSDAEAEE